MDKEREHIIADKTMLRVARVTSIVFTPFSIPFLAFLVLFLFSYLRIMPILYKGIVLGIVYCFTILTPTITIFLFRKINGFARQDLSERKKRYVPILLTIISYVFCLLMMRKLNIPWYMTGIIFVSLVVSIICILVNLKWKLSEHMAGMGGIIGGLVSFSALFSYNPVYSDCGHSGLCTDCFGTSHFRRSAFRFCCRLGMRLFGTPSGVQLYVQSFFILKTI